jgi:NitT/TauT family transport system permease protein
MSSPVHDRSRRTRGGDRRELLLAVALPLGAAALAVGLWQLAVGLWQLAVTTHGHGHSRVFPAPVQVARAFAELARRGVLAAYVRDSLLRVGGGYLLALAVGLPAGLAMGWSPGLARAWNPLVQLLRPISPLAWIPVAIVLFGVKDAAAVFLIFLAAVFPIVVAASNGVQSVPPVYLQAARNFGLSPGALLARVVLPAALPRVLVGLRVALGVSWLVVVAAEMIAVDSGLGYLIIDARNAGKRYDLVLAAILLIGAIGLALDLLARRIERLRAVRWGFLREGQ